MTTYDISSKCSGATLGTYTAETPQGALDAMAREAGYADHAEACRVSGDAGEHLLVVEVES
jgi:hypothetical protein